jgi:uncharacterized protein YdaU (DUF1376 family)
LSERPWYRRFPSDFIAGTIGLSLEEKGAYSMVLDLIYDRQGPIPDDPKWIAGVCGCSVRKWHVIRTKLLVDGKLTDLGGTLSNKRAMKEIETSSETSRKLAENGAKGGYKKAENYRGFRKINSLEMAGLQHARDYKLKLERGWDMTDELRPVDRVNQPMLFEACVRLAPTWNTGGLSIVKFPQSVVEKAKKEMTDG